MFETIPDLIVSYRYLWLTITIVFTGIDAWDSTLLARMREAYKEANERGLSGIARLEYATTRMEKEVDKEMRERPLLHIASLCLISAFVGLFILSFILEKTQ